MCTITTDKMVSAETVGGKLKEAATKKADESILIQIADKDLALKVKYHKQCYSNLRPSTNRKHFRAFVYV